MAHCACCGLPRKGWPRCLHPCQGVYGREAPWPCKNDHCPWALQSFIRGLTQPSERGQAPGHAADDAADGAGGAADGASLKRRKLSERGQALGHAADDAADELAASTAWVKENVSKTPVGAACPLRKTTEIKELLEKGTQGVLSAGSLSALSLPATALDRGGHVIEREPVCYACGALAQPSPLWRTADRGRFSWWPPRTSSADDGDAADLLLVEVREGDIVTELGYRPGHKYLARIVHRLTSELMEQREVMRRRLARLGTADRASPSSERGQAVDGVDDDRRTSWADDGDPEAWVEVREGDIVTELGYRPGHTYPARIVHPLTSELMMAKAAAAEVARLTSAASPKNQRGAASHLTNKIADSTQLKPQKGGTGVRRPADYRLRRGEEDQEVRHPQATDAGAQAQACAEGGHQGDLREGGEGGGEARTAASSWRPPCPYELHRRFEERVEGGEGLARQGSQGLDLSQQQLFSVAIKDR